MNVSQANKLKSNLAKRPLTKVMEELLMDCHERELLHLDPCEAGSVKYAAKGLIERDFLISNFYINKQGKKIMALFITDSGRGYLKNL